MLGKEERSRIYILTTTPYFKEFSGEILWGKDRNGEYFCKLEFFLRRVTCLREFAISFPYFYFSAEELLEFGGTFVLLLWRMLASLKL